MRPEFFVTIIDGFKAKPNNRDEINRLARGLGEMMGRGDSRDLAMARSILDAGMRQLEKMEDPVCKQTARSIALLLEVAASAYMAIETRKDDEAVVGHIAKPPYSIILPILDAETVRLSVLVTRSGLSADIVTKAVGCLAEAHLAEGHGKPDPLVRITSRGCKALKGLRAKTKNAPPAS